MRVIGNEGKHVCTFRDKSHGRQPCAPCLGFVWLGKVAQHNSGVHSAAGVAGNGRGVIVGCLQQYQKRWGFVRMASSRAAWPHALHGKQQQQQQREKSRRDQVWVFRLLVLFWSGNISRAWGTGLVIIGGVFVEIDDEFVFLRWIHLSIETFFFNRIF